LNRKPKLKQKPKTTTLNISFDNILQRKTLEFKLNSKHFSYILTLYLKHKT